METIGLLAAWVWGSFVNQLIDRTPLRGAQGPEVPPGLTRPPGLLHPPRSLCLGCGQTLRWWENLPVVSYLLLRGRCRSCGAPIGKRTLLVEIAVPAAWLLLAWLTPDWELAGLIRLGLFLMLTGTLLTVLLLIEQRRLTPGIIMAAVGLGTGALTWL